MNQGPSVSTHSFGYQPGGYPPPQQPGYTPYNAPPPGWNAPNQELADLGPRILAYLIDSFIVGAIIGVAYGIVAVLILVMAGATSGSEAGQEASSLFILLICLVMIPLTLGITFFNLIYLAGKNNGQTIGKKVMKIRIVKEGGGSFGYMDAFLRNVVGYWISSLVCDLGFIWGLFDSRHQTWHDKIFKTVVVKA